MIAQTFEEYLKSQYTSPGSGTAHSYKTAIKILDEIFRQNDVFNLKNTSLCEIKDPFLIAQIVDFVADEEEKIQEERRLYF